MEGVPYSEIISMYPRLKLTKSDISAHKAHFTDPAAVELVEDVSDHEYVDMMRKLSTIYLKKGLTGAALSMTETRIVQATARALADRRHITDAQKETTALEELLKQASESRYKYEASDLKSADDAEVV